MRYIFTLLSILLLCDLRADVPAFQSGNRWCVLGDSITESGGYHQYVELFYLTRFPTKPMDVMNCGIRGDTALGANQRLEWDCLSAKPTVVSVMFGMNDVSPSFYKYKDRTDFEKKCAERAEPTTSPCAN